MVKRDYYGASNPHWKGGWHITPAGYKKIKKREHLRANPLGYVFEHILIVEKALGKPLPPWAVTHHHTPEQIVLCQDQAYHMLLHQRTRSLRACSHAGWRKCQFCKKWDRPEDMVYARGTRYHHKECRNAYNRNRYHKKKMEVANG